MHSVSQTNSEVPASAETVRLEQASSSPLSAERIHYLDNLRAAAMLLGVYLHAALAYAAPAQQVWLATDGDSRRWIDVSIWWIHLFRMSLFFLLAGYFGKLVWARRGWQRFFTGRLIRLAGPMALFYPFALIAMTLNIVFAINYLEAPQGLMGIIAAAAKSPDPPPADPPGTMHFWFLYYLLAFTIVSLLAVRYWPRRGVLDLWSSERWPVTLAFGPLLFVPVFVSAGNPLPPPESFLPTWWPFVFYGSFYYAGWQLLGREEVLEQLDRWRWWISGFALILFVPYYALLPAVDLRGLTMLAPQFSLSTTVVSMLAAYSSVWWTLVAIVWGKRLLPQHRGWISFIADSSYWIYIVHLPLVIFWQIFLIPFSWPAELKLCVVIIATLLPAWAVYLVFIRYTPVGWMLHGKRKFP